MGQQLIDAACAALEKSDDAGARAALLEHWKNSRSSGVSELIARLDARTPGPYRAQLSERLEALMSRSEPLAAVETATLNQLDADLPALLRMLPKLETLDVDVDVDTVGPEDLARLLALELQRLILPAGATREKLEGREARVAHVVIGTRHFRRDASGVLRRGQK
jgi:hypothetical protein